MRISDWSSDVCSSDLHRDRHWREGLALDSLEGEQRREHHEDDRLPEQRRADHLLDRTRHLLEPLAHVQYSHLMLLTLGHAYQAVLDDDDRATDDHPEAEAAQATTGTRHPHPINNGK